MKLHGVIPPVVTPFKSDGSIDSELFQKFIEHLIGAGVHGIFVAGGTGEYTSLSADERQHLFEAAVGAVGGRIPVLAGVGCPSSDESVRIAKIAERCGMAATVATNPHYPRPSQEDIFNYHRDISQSTSIPHIVYNLPKYGVDMSVDMVVRLAENGLIQGIKDSHNEFWHTVDVIRRTGDDFTVLTGYSKYFLPTLLMGGQGSINVISNLVPRTMVELYDSFKSRNLDRACSLQMRIYPLADLIFSIGPYISVLKEALRLAGWDMGTPRRPLLPLDPESTDKLKAGLESVGLSDMNSNS